MNPIKLVVAKLKALIDRGVRPQLSNSWHLVFMRVIADASETKAGKTRMGLSVRSAKLKATS